MFAIALAASSDPLPFTIVDVHTHLTNVSKFEYQGDWVTQSFLPSNYTHDTVSSDLPSSKVIFMEAAVDPKMNVQEAQWVQGLADDPTTVPKIAGICAFVPLENGRQAIEPVIQELISSVPLFKGVRRILETKPLEAKHGSTDPCWFLNTSFSEGLSVLAEHSLHFELLTRVPEQFNCTLELVQRAPQNLTIVMQHLGGPNMSNPIEKQGWSKYVDALSQHENVVAKISGVPERADQAPLPEGKDTWTEEQVKPYIMKVIEAFGYDRVVFGGNWFVVERFSNYSRWASTLLDILGDTEDTLLKKLFHDNADKYYRL